MDRDRELHEMADEGRALMSDYIKREDALEQFDYYDLGEYLTTQIRGMLMDVPSADVAPIIHGDWKEEKITFNKWGGDVATEKTLWRCSVCGHEDSILTNYCSKCGARMDGEK